MAGIILNDEQNAAYNHVVFNRKNLFITGRGGTGKSELIKKIYKDMASYHIVGLTSLTGVSAHLIGGVTLHSYLGIRLGVGSFEKLLKLVEENKIIKNRWIRLDLLIVDEVSMLSMELFDKLEHIARVIRRNDKPFGGIQLLFSGDFYQLPCVLNDYFCFESDMWNKCFEHYICLEKVIRQTDDAFINTLNKIRTGDIDDECKRLIESREIPYLEKTGLIPTMLYAINAKVDAANEKYYNKLSGDEYVYKIAFVWKQRVFDKEKYENMARFQFELRLKKGAQVMHLVNTSDGELVNGSRGVVVDFVEGWPEVKFSNGLKKIITPAALDIEEGDFVVLSYMQVPLKLAFAASIHKSQGCTLDLVRIDLKNVFEYGQFYTALSRVKSLDGLYIRNLDWNKVKVSPKVIKFYKSLK